MARQWLASPCIAMTQRNHAARSTAPTDQFDGMIGPGQILAWVASSCPFLLPRIAGFAQSNTPPRDLMGGADGWLRVLAAAPLLSGAKPTYETREDYLALCLAAHHATVGSYVPTDVDNKIRGDLWRRQSGESLQRRWQLATTARAWSPEGVSTRVESTSVGPVSGHQGEWLGVAAGAYGAALIAGDRTVAAAASEWMHTELEREAQAYIALETAVRSHDDPAHAVALARLAWILTHNAGDVDQGLSHWPTGAVGRLLDEPRRIFAEIAHVAPQRYGGVYHRAKAVYQLVAGEGHRHYPLRAVKALRTDASLLMPLGPCLEAWGATVATSPALDDHARADVLAALCHGIGTIGGQVGYQRALVGLATCPGGLARLIKRLPAKEVERLDDPGVRRHLALSAEAFAAHLAERIRTVVRSQTQLGQVQV